MDMPADSTMLVGSADDTRRAQLELALKQKRAVDATVAQLEQLEDRALEAATDSGHRRTAAAAQEPFGRRSGP